MAFRFSDFFQKVPEEKASRAAPLIALFSENRARWSPRDYATMAREGFAENPIGFRAVHMIAEAVASLPLVLYEGDRELDRHSLLDLLRHPNPRQSRMELLEAVAGHLLVSGNAYLELVSVAGAARELYALRPDRMKIVPGPEGWPEAYEYSVGLRSMRFELSETPRPVLHVALFNPSDDHYGLSPVEAAAKALDVHNAASAWNKALLDNAARPSGALVYSAAGGNLADEQFERLKRELELHYQGAANAGRPLLLEGGLDWKSLSLSPKDMDFIEAKNSAAREIALAFGVPPMLLGIPGDNTYSNYQEANRALYRQTVLPLAERIFSALTQWLSPLFGGELRLAPDLDQITALAPERADLWKRIGEANFLTDDEKRIAVGYGARPAEEKFDPGQPRVPAGNSDGGQWTNGGNGGDDGVNDLRVLSDFDEDEELVEGEHASIVRLLRNLLKRPTPVEPGSVIRNRGLAGKNHPESGIPYDREGFPDFSGVTSKTVRLPHTGHYSTDSAAANRAAGFTKTPDGMTWHHHQDGRTMQLVPKRIHEQTGHTGSIGIGNLPGKN